MVEILILPSTRLAHSPNEPRAQINAAFPINDLDALRSTMLERPLAEAFPVDGMLPLCYWDDTLINVMSNSGEQRGKVWSVRVAAEAESSWYPGGRTHQLSFLEWYEEWLDWCLTPSVASRWSKPNRDSKLRTVSLSAMLRHKSISRSSFLDTVRLCRGGIELFLAAVDATLDEPLDRKEIDCILRDVAEDKIRDMPYDLYEGPLGHIFVRTDPWGHELIFDVSGPQAHNTRDRCTVHERVTDLLQAFAESYLLHMEDGVDNDLLFRISTAHLLDWAGGAPKLKCGISDTP